MSINNSSYSSSKQEGKRKLNDSKGHKAAKKIKKNPV